MKAAVFAALFMTASMGLANASSYPAKHVSRNGWQANASPAPQISPRPCISPERQDPYINSLGEYIPSVNDPGPGAD